MKIIPNIIECIVINYVNGSVDSNTFYQVNAISTSVWKFQRYSLVIEYEGKPILPPPFIFLCHLYLIVRYMQWRCRDKEEVYFDNCLSEYAHISH